MVEVELESGLESANKKSTEKNPCFRSISRCGSSGLEGDRYSLLFKVDTRNLFDIGVGHFDRLGSLVDAGLIIIY